MSSSQSYCSNVFASLLTNAVDNSKASTGGSNLVSASAEYFFIGIQRHLEGFKLGVNYVDSRENLLSFLGKVPSTEERLRVLLTGVASLRLFVACNWTGYRLKNTEIMESMSDVSFYKDRLVNDILDSEGEGLYPAIKHPEFLALARLILIDGSQVIQENFWILDFWKLRCLIIHQECLLESSERVHDDGVAIITRMDAGSSEVEDPAIRALFYLEATAFFAQYREVGKMKEYFDKSSDIIGIEVNATGALGKRTKFQQSDVAQYILDIKKNSSDIEGQHLSSENTTLPKNLKLNDEVRLNSIKFKEERSSILLTTLERAAVLTAFTVVYLSQPQDALSLEELLPYIETVLSNNDIWAFQVSALLHRSILESKDRRTIERAKLQVQILSEDLSTLDEDVGNDRLNLLFVSRLMPFWKMEAELVKLLIALGSTSTALEVALRLELWEDVINCYHRLQLRHKAAEVIQKQLSIKETPLLWCMLGDATDDLGHYEKALEISNGRNSRALRSIGYHYYFKKDYQTAVDYLKKSLDMNGCQQHLRLRLGYAAMELQNWELAASAYRNYCALESDNFEAWNNLANAYIKLGQKARAWKVLQEAIKCDFENWKVWENILLVSTDCAHFEEVIRAYNRLLDLKDGKHVDVQVLSVLVKAINDNLLDSYQRPAGKFFRKPAMQLFGRLTSSVLDESQIWELYSDLTDADLETNAEERDYKAAMLLHRAVSVSTKKPHWDSDTSNVKSILKLGHKLVQAAMKSASSSSNTSQSVQFLSSVKMTLNGVVVVVEKSHVSPTNEILESIKDDFEVLRNDIKETLTSKVASLK